jgi:hypothetical protein
MVYRIVRCFAAMALIAACFCPLGAFAQQTREQWVAAELVQEMQDDSTPMPPRGLIRDERLKVLESLPPGTRVFPIPGVLVKDGARMGDFLNCSFTLDGDHYSIWRKGTIIARYPASAHVVFLPRAGRYFAEPGHKMPTAYLNERPLTVVP